MLQRFRRRTRGDGGAVAVEAALITPLILLIIFGIIEFTLLLKDDVAISSAVRAGARTASAEPRSASFLDDTAAQMDRAVATLDKNGLNPALGAELWIYKANAAGYPGSATSINPGGCSTKCVRYTYDATAKKFVTSDPERAKWPPTSINACPKDPTLNPSGPDSVGVYLSFRHAFLTGVFGGGITLSDHTVLNFEPVPPTQGCK